MSFRYSSWNSRFLSGSSDSATRLQHKGDPPIGGCADPDLRHSDPSPSGPRTQPFSNSPLAT
eukprot:5484839-Amphidinium_carterae.1